MIPDFDPDVYSAIALLGRSRNFFREREAQMKQDLEATRKLADKLERLADTTVWEEERNLDAAQRKVDLAQLQVHNAERRLIWEERQPQPKPSATRPMLYPWRDYPDEWANIFAKFRT